MQVRQWKGMACRISDGACHPQCAARQQTSCALLTTDASISQRMVQCRSAENMRNSGLICSVAESEPLASRNSSSEHIAHAWTQCMWSCWSALNSVSAQRNMSAHRGLGWSHAAFACYSDECACLTQCRSDWCRNHFVQ